MPRPKVCWLLLRRILADTLSLFIKYDCTQKITNITISFSFKKKKYLHINTIYKKFTKQNCFKKEFFLSFFLFSLFRKID